MQRPASRKKGAAVYIFEKRIGCSYTKIKVQIPGGKRDYTKCGINLTIGNGHL
jgi:hypothetical protein